MSNLQLNSLVLICGLSCTGKTLGARILSSWTTSVHYEASSIMREMFERESIGDHDFDLFALEALTSNPTKVPETILRRAQEKNHPDIVVSGFRSPIEVSFMLDAARKTTSVFVKASPEIRFKRYVARRRESEDRSHTAFQDKDEIQQMMGINLVEKMVGRNVLFNEGSIEEFERSLIKMTPRRDAQSDLSSD